MKTLMHSNGVLMTASVSNLKTFFKPNNVFLYLSAIENLKAV